MVEDSSEEVLLENIRNNIKWVLKNRYEDSQTLMANELGIKTNTLHTYLNSRTKPPITFLYVLCLRNNITLDQLAAEDLSLCEEKLKKKDAVKKLYSKYTGEYFTYFYVVDSNSLKEGLIQEGILKINDFGNVSFDIINSNKIFTGNFVISDELIYFDLKNSKEKINITMKNPGKNIREKYLCGIGIINISSPEDSRIPSAQKFIISRERIAIDKYYKTLCNFLSINIYFKIRKRFLVNELEKIIDLRNEKYNKLKELVEDSKISSEDKIIIGQKQMDLILEVLDKEEYLALKGAVLSDINGKEVTWINNIKVNLEEEKMVYRFIKNEFKSTPGVTQGC